MPGSGPLAAVIHNLLRDNDLPFRDFVELALYHPDFGYYAKRARPEADYVTSPRLSPLFADSLSVLIRDLSSRAGDVVSTVVDVGCGDGSLLLSLSSVLGPRSSVRFYGVDRSLERLSPEAQSNAALHFVRTIEEVPRDGAHLVLANELFDALPFARLVQRDEHLHELWVTDRDGELDWTEHEAPGAYEDYFSARRIALSDGQFADISLEWEAYYRDLCAFVRRGLIVTFDYGFPQEQLFSSRIRRFGTAASYHAQRVTRDLLASPGEQDITAHINFTDLIRAGEQAAFHTLFFDRQAKFLLALGAAEHRLIQGQPDSVEGLHQKENARRLILPDGIGEDIRVLVQARAVPRDGWTFQRKLY
ncbi:MAG TPA: SAM-dependent methyltransferase [Thermoanaerobaculia bacterium]